MKLSNTTIYVAMITANIFALYWGGYHTLMPILYISGLALTSVIYGWMSLRMKTRDLMVLTSISIIVAFIDEYSHTVAEAFTYFDRMQPSPLTVFGWGLFIPVILTLAQHLYEKISLEKLLNNIPRIAPAIISILMLIICFWTQNYFFILLQFPIALVYIFLVVSSLFYTSQQKSGWNTLVMIISLVTSALMEFIGAMEGMWTFHFNEPLQFFLLFTWTLRTWTILAIASILGVELHKPE